MSAVEQIEDAYQRGYDAGHVDGYNDGRTDRGLSWATDEAKALIGIAALFVDGKTTKATLRKYVDAYYASRGKQA